MCLYPGSDPDAARAAILASLRPGTPDAPGLFAPGSFPMGTDVYLSHVVATVAAVPYVDAVAVTEAPPGSRIRPAPSTRYWSWAPPRWRCANDPSAPDRGQILLTVEGG